MPAPAHRASVPNHRMPLRIMLKKWLRPKWQHPDPLTRLESIGEQALEQSVLEQLAKHDPSLEVRRAALRRLDNLHLLVGLTGVSSEVSDAARVRVRRLLRAMGPGEEPDSALLAEAITVCDDPGLARELALRSTSSRIRRTAIELLTDEQALVAAAAEDDSPELRLAAARRVHSEHALRDLERAVRNRDKRVAQLARQRLTKLREASEHNTERETLIGELETLGGGGSWPADEAAWLRIRSRWPALAADADPVQAERFQQASAAFTQRLETFRAQRSREREIRQHRQALLKELDRLAETIGAQATAESRRRLGEIQSAWGLLPAVQGPDTVEEAFLNKCQATQKAVEQAQALGLIATRLEALEAQILSLKDRSQMDHRHLARLKQELETLPHSLDQRCHALKNRVNALIQDRERQVETEREHLGEIQSTLAALEQALDQNHLDSALHAHKKASDLLHRLQRVTPSKRRTLETRLRAAGPRLAELKSWRHWGSDQAREELIGRAVALTDTRLEPSKVAKVVKGLREQWKRLGHLDPGGKALWERFDSACSRAIQPALEQRREAAAARKNHLGQRAEICANLERLATETDWAAPDWRALDKAVHRLRRSWRACGPVDRHDWQVVKARYDEAVHVLEARMEGERRHNRLQRETLVLEAEALLESDALHDAAAKARDLREAWRVTVSSPQGEEKRLWKRFQEATGAIVNREHRARQAHRQTLNENLEQVQALCDELDRLCEHDDDTVLGSQKQAQRLLHEVESHGPLPPRARQGAEDRIQQVRRTFEDRVKQAQKRLQDQHMRFLKDYAGLCERLEQAALQGKAGRELLAEIEQAWSALPDLEDSNTRERLEKRLDLAKRMAVEPAVRQDLAPTLESNLERCRALCLDLEILLGRDSPECERESRLQHQVSLLSQAMTEGRREEPSERAHRLLRELLLCGPIPVAEAPALRTRLERLSS
jgi:exonuclease SbcC